MRSQVLEGAKADRVSGKGESVQSLTQDGLQPCPPIEGLGVLGQEVGPSCEKRAEADGVLIMLIGLFIGNGDDESQCVLLRSINLVCQ